MPSIRTLSALFLASFFCVSAPALAGPMHEGHHGQKMSEPAKKKPCACCKKKLCKTNPAVKAYESAMDAMHKGMDITYTGNTDTDFARGMVPHHQGAVDMAKVQLQFGTDPELRKLAQWIVTSQQQEIGLMKRWLDRRGTSAVAAGAAETDSVKALTAATHAMHEAMNIDYTGNADIDFARGMIPHHAGAVAMAEAQLKHGVDAELRTLAKDIILSQKREIAQMERWLEAHPAPAPEAKMHNKKQHGKHH